MASHAPTCSGLKSPFRAFSVSYVMGVATQQTRECSFMPRVKATPSRKANQGSRSIGLFSPSVGYQAIEEVLAGIRDGTYRTARRAP